jgi:hypothetical protein
LLDIETIIGDTNLTFEINTKNVPLAPIAITSPELGKQRRDLQTQDVNSRQLKNSVNL